MVVKKEFEQSLSSHSLDKSIYFLISWLLSASLNCFNDFWSQTGSVPLHLPKSKAGRHGHLPLIIIIGLVHYFISVDRVTQLRYRQLQDVGTVGLHHEVICYKIPSDAQVPLEFGDVLDGLGSYY